MSWGQSGQSVTAVLVADLLGRAALVARGRLESGLALERQGGGERSRTSWAMYGSSSGLCSCGSNTLPSAADVTLAPRSPRGTVRGTECERDPIVAEM